jgi:hypothetical protein
LLALVISLVASKAELATKLLEPAGAR